MTDNTGPWLEIAVEVAGIDAEIAADLLRQACTGGVAIETPSRLDRDTETYVPDGDAIALIKGYLQPGPDAERLQQNMRLALQTAPLQRPAAWREPTLLADADWRDSWKRYFGVQRIRKLVGNSPRRTSTDTTAGKGPGPDPASATSPDTTVGKGPGPDPASATSPDTTVGKGPRPDPSVGKGPSPDPASATSPDGEGRLVIVPSWVDHTPKPDDIVLRIDPGMAFGTGQHPTTAMCLAALEYTITGGQSVLDLGCGSGILAIAAAKLLAHNVGKGPSPDPASATSPDRHRILAIDNDPLATKAAAENAAANSVSLEIRTSTLDEPAERFDVIVANISGLTLQRLAPLLSASLNDGGALIASGFLDEALADVTAAFGAAGLTADRVIEDGQWRCVIASK